MISELKKTISLYHRLEEAWTANDKNSDDYLAAVCLFENMSYRLFETAKRDPLIGWRMIRRVWKRTGQNNDAVLAVDPAGDSIVLGGIIKTRDHVLQYVKRSSGASVRAFIAKDFVPVLDTGRLAFLMALLPFAIGQAIRCMRHPRRLNLALSIAEVAEIAYICYYARTQGIKRVYNFIPYEKDSNMLSIALREMGVTTTMIPSSGPLVTHNRILVADEIIVSTPYHTEETKKFKDTLRANKFTLWPPERAFLYIDQYLDHPQAPTKTIGFYSHGDWVRREEQHAEHGRKVGPAERAILAYLSRFVKENPEYRLIIFPHPREKKQDVLQKTKAFYEGMIGHASYEVVTEQLGTANSFHHVDIAVAAFSTILYERLFCGYKTLIGNMGINDFPLNGSSLSSICFRSYEEMQAMLVKYASQSDDQYFQSTGLSDYRFSNYPKP